MGVELPVEARDALVAVQVSLAARSEAIRLERAEKLHITIRFLGATVAGRIDEIAAALRTAATTAATHAVSLAAIGAFPTPARAKVIWAGVGGNVDPLLELERKVSDALAKVGIAREQRPFHPHITIARVQRDVTTPHRHSLRDAIASVTPPPPVSFAVRRVVLFESVPDRGGTSYVPLHTCTLSAAEVLP